MSARQQIRSAIVIAVLVVLSSFALLFVLSVIGTEETAGRPPNTGAPITFPTQNPAPGGFAPTRTPAALPTGEDRR